MTAEPNSPRAAIRVDLGAIFVSLELSKSTWLVTSLSPVSEKMSRHSVAGGDLPALLTCLSLLREKARAREGRLYPVVVIQEAGLDGFWLHRALEAECWITSHVVDAASIAVSPRHRRAKTDSIDGETLVRTLMAWMRGEPRVCAMVRVPAIEDEDRRRIGRERKALVEERKRHVNRIKGLLFTVGVRGYEPARRDRRERLDDLRTGDGRPLPAHLKAQLCRELDRLELVNEQIKAVEAERDAHSAKLEATAPQAMLEEIKGIGAEFASTLAHEGLFRQFGNRRQIAAYAINTVFQSYALFAHLDVAAGLAPSPWRSGSIDREQGVSKAGNPRLRTTMIQLAWLWLRYQPASALTRWFHERVSMSGGRTKKVAIVALARKLLVALWKYVTNGVVIEGAVMARA
ncbi:MAG: IS110 family transposase [Mesorhizobium sp.]|uniref:IS110 family transposase n=1 Tax=Mesorhizobium sp. TaxID=1871066 RepID=UPI000FE5EFD2|nr:IS110 family transposase [Mesorhizobium sp.]RWA88194.1 MAG: IS110 family transposase [Mesorhizobium sp.]RWB58679.1 MAG: IS110 family transposase [Mesorhizobium sp.]TIU35752.1 MAG: IS110 family transposase [Mesorhizobium sp.]